MEPESDVINGNNWRVRFFREGDRASLQRLSTAHFGDKEPGQPSYFEWLYSGGPAGRAALAVCEEISSGEIVGFAFHVPFRVKFGDKYDICFLGCNALVRKDYRGFGIYPKLSDLILGSNHKAAFLYGFPKPGALTAHKKVGKFPVSTIPLLVRPLDISQLAQMRFQNPLVRFGVKAGWKAAGGTIWRPRTGGAVRNKIQIGEQLQFDHQFDRFWEQVANKYSIIVKRDSAFLTWRFKSTDFRSYEILTAKLGDDLLGYAVLRNTEIDRIPVGLIMDLLVDSGAQGDKAGLLLAGEALRRFKHAKVALAGCLILPHTQEYRILRRAGYLDIPARFSPQVFRLMTTSLSSRAPREFLSHSDNWFITMANHDAI